MRHLPRRWTRRNPALQYVVTRRAYDHRCHAERDDLNMRTLSQAFPPTSKYSAIWRFPKDGSAR